MECGEVGGGSVSLPVFALSTGQSAECACGALVPPGAQHSCPWTDLQAFRATAHAEPWRPTATRRPGRRSATLAPRFGQMVRFDAQARATVTVGRGKRVAGVSRAEFIESMRP